jgi:prepilin-type N-terminal cleavage/methylation domain-containing protein
MKTTPTRESGFTLLELLLVIGVAALLLIGGITTYRLVSDGNKATESTRQLLTIRQETQTMAQQNGGVYTGIAYDITGAGNATSPLVTSGVLRNPQRNPFNGEIIIAPTGTGDVNLRVEFGNISQSACTKMAMAINNPAEVVSVNVVAAAAGATTGGTALTIPATAANAATACAAALNDVVWVFP